jgi:hypothetical protein
MEKSESWIVALLVAAILLSVVSIAMNMGVTQSPLTGRSTKDGNVTANLEDLVECVLIEDAIDFGTIALGTTYESNAGTGRINLKNNGTVKVNVTVASGKLPESFFSGTSPEYQYKTACSESSCGSDLVASFTSFTTSNQTVVKLLEFAADKDRVNTDVKITVPGDEPAGAKADVLTYTCIQA